MNNVIFRISPKAIYGITALVVGLLVFDWVHWHGQRQTELVVFSVLTAIALSLYSLSNELGLSLTNREISSKSTWLGVALRKKVVRVGTDDTLYLTEETARGSGQGFTVWHSLEASGQLVSHQGDYPAPYVLGSQQSKSNRKKLETFAQEAAKCLGVSLEDNRKFKGELK
jgi:hypothetical protein